MLKQIFSKKMLLCFLMGFASGLPLLLTLSTLQAWMKDANVDIRKIGLFALVGLPYSWKFVWAPIFDRFQWPWLGRRRGWLLITQILLTLAIALLGFANPKTSLLLLASVACLVAFFSASQDIVIDSYRRELLADEELGLGSSMYVYGYRVAMLAAGAGALILADMISWRAVYFAMALCMLPGIATTFWASEPVNSEATPKTFRESVIDPFLEFFERKGAWLVLAFILFYKVGDTMASSMTIPFYLDLGFSKTEIGTITKLFGFWATIGGTFLGGVLLLRWGIVKSLYLFGVLQGVSTAGFAILSVVGYSQATLAAVVAGENISAGMGTAAYMAYMATQTNKKFTATQYALLTSLMGIPRTVLASPTGYIVKSVGWFNFFLFCSLIAIPGLVILWRLVPWNSIVHNPMQST